MSIREINLQNEQQEALVKEENHVVPMMDDEDDDDDDLDGGWGWVVVFASFMVHVLADGVTYSFGVLTTEFISHFGASREAVGWMASILVGMTLSAGPLASILCNKFGFRTVTIIGSFISAIGFCAPFFYPEFWFLYFSASVISGLGFGLVYLPSIVTVSIYFKRKRAFAIGLAVCGSGIGTFVFSPLIEYLIETYGWRGTMLIVGGLIFNCLACGAVYRPKKSYEDSISMCSSSMSSICKANLNNGINVKSLMKHSLHHKNHHHRSSESLARVYQSVTNVTMSPSKIDASAYIYSAPDMQRMIHSTHAFKTHVKKPILKVSHPHLLISSQISLQLSHLRKDLFIHEVHRKSETSVPLSETGKESVFSSAEIKGCIQDVFDVELLKAPVFILFALSNFFTSIGFNAPFLYAKDRALQMGIENNQASFLISSIGIGNTFGRVIFGYLSTKSFINRLNLYNTSLLISGIVVMLSSYAITYFWMIVYTLGFGLLTGTYVTLTSIVLVDLLGIEKLNASFGMTMVAQGAAVFIGPPLAGWIYDITFSFDWSFFVCGAFLAISGLMLFLVYCSKDYRKHGTSQKNQS
uniref:Slc16a-14 n=1 Tax=Schmidtea mediterranea TaxID=79327 RepID=A0A0H3YJ52_SCHMD|nr:slc16a-14 [Schmidtea mediterranea]